MASTLPAECVCLLTASPAELSDVCRSSCQLPAAGETPSWGLPRWALPKVQTQNCQQNKMLWKASCGGFVLQQQMQPRNKEPHSPSGNQRRSNPHLNPSKKSGLQVTVVSLFAWVFYSLIVNGSWSSSIFFFRFPLVFLPTKHHPPISLQTFSSRFLFWPHWILVLNWIPGLYSSIIQILHEPYLRVLNFSVFLPTWKMPCTMIRYRSSEIHGICVFQVIWNIAMRYVSYIVLYWHNTTLKWISTMCGTASDPWGKQKKNKDPGSCGAQAFLQMGDRQ